MFPVSELSAVNSGTYVGSLDDMDPHRLKGRKRDDLTIFQIGNLQIEETVRLFVLQIEVIINFILDIFSAIVGFIFKVISLLGPYFFYFLLFVFFYWLAHIAWPFTMKVFVLIGIPLAEMILIAANIIFKIVIFIYLVIGTIWNATVPFLGMLLMFVFDIVFTILDAINQILGAIDLGALFNDLMPLLNIIMEIIIQIIQVIIQVGEPILNALLQIIVPLLEIIISIIRILLPIIEFLFKVIYFVLQPIIWLLEAFFGGGQSGSYGPEDTTNTARKLLSLNLFGGDDESGPHIYEGYDPYARMVMSTLNMTPAEFYTEIHKNTSVVVEKDLWQVPQMTGRRPLEYNVRKTGLRFADLDDEDEDGESVENIQLGGGGPKGRRSSHDDDLTYNFVHTFYRSSRTIPKETMDETSGIFSTIMDHYKNVDPLTTSAIYASYNREHGYLHGNPEDRLGSVRYASSIEHPNSLNERLTNERTAKRNEILSAQQFGRKLLDMTIYPDNANEHLNHYMSTLEKQHAMQVMDQAKAYKDKHSERMKLASVVMGGVSMTMKKHAETTFHPDNIAMQCNAMLQTLGYNDIWDWHTQMTEEFKDAEEYLLSFAQYFDNPVFNFVKTIDVSNDDDVIYFKDWSSEQVRMSHSDAFNSGRKLFSVDEDNNMDGTGNSQVAASGFATVSSRNCNTDPKHPLCAPLPPISVLRYNLPGLGISQKFKNSLLQNTSDCSPWKTTDCFICADRFYNAGVEIIFLIVAIPPVNYALASVTRMVPWTGSFLNWMFIVPKFKRATTLQWLCFARETFSLFIVALIIGAGYWLLWPFVQAIWRAFRSAIKIKATPPKQSEEVEMLDNYYRNTVENYEVQPPRTTLDVDGIFVSGRIGGTDTHIHHHNYGSQSEVHLLRSFVRHLMRSEKRASVKLESLLGYLGLYHYNLHVKHPAHIDTDASKQEDSYLSHESHPIHGFIEYKGGNPPAVQP